MDADELGPGGFESTSARSLSPFGGAKGQSGRSTKEEWNSLKGHPALHAELIKKKFSALPSTCLIRSTARPEGHGGIAIVRPVSGE